MRMLGIYVCNIETGNNAQTLWAVTCIRKWS